MLLPRLVLALALAMPLAGSRAGAAIVDGRLDPVVYGAARSIQTTQTTMEVVAGLPYYDSELDDAYGFVQDDTLHLFFGGNLVAIIGPVNPVITWDYLAEFTDDSRGG